MYAECVARQLWRSDLDALIKGYSKEETMKALVVVLEQLDTNDPCLPWYCRVPSPYNVADLQSRGKWKELFALFPECMRSFCILPFSVPETFRGSNRQKKEEVHSWRKMGYKEESLQSKVLYLFGMKLNVWILQRRNPKDVWDNEKCPSVHSVWWNLNSPCLSFALEKDGFRTVILVQFQWCLYIYICIYMFISRPILTVAIASFKFLDL